MNVRVVAALALLLTACGTTSDTDTAQPEAAPEQPCQAAPADLLARIADGASGVELSVTDGAMVRSNDFDDVTMVAMRFTVPGVDEAQVGVWAVGGVDDPTPGTILAIDGFAHNFTHWPYGPDTQFAVSQADDGVDQARDCLG